MKELKYSVYGTISSQCSLFTQLKTPEMLWLEKKPLERQVNQVYLPEMWCICEKFNSMQELLESVNNISSTNSTQYSLILYTLLGLE